jgi:hyperosmotically inducible protein
MKRNFAIVISILVFTLAIVVGCQTNNNKNRNSNLSNATERGKVKKGDWGISRQEFERQKKRFEKEAKDLGRKIGNSSEDLWIWTATRAALAYADDLRDTTIEVDVENEVVTLSGTVATDGQKTKAEEIARSIEGIKSVKNDLTIIAGKDLS